MLASQKPVSTMTLAELKAEVERLHSQLDRRTGIKIGPKGTVVVSGFGKYPVSLYADQWERLSGIMPQVVKFIEENKASLSYKA